MQPNAPINNQRTNICLNMIVKNEAMVLPRLIKSVHSYIDYYVIVDTGSTDGTPDLIKTEMRKYGIDGEVYYHEWVDFGHNRQIALERAITANKADWLLFIDADEEFDVSDSDFYKYFEKGVSYRIEKQHSLMRYTVLAIIDISENRWEWKGVVHNYLKPLTNGRQELLKNLCIIYHLGEGAKSQGVTPEEKYLRDAKLLEAELIKYPDDTRSQFYLAQSYRDAGFLYQEKAYTHYLKRSKMTHGWMDENYFSLLEAGRISHLIKKPLDETFKLLTAAHELRPNRAEALFHLARLSRLHKKFYQSYQYAKAATEVKIPDEGLYIMQGIYLWRRWNELALAAIRLGRFKKSVDAYDVILREIDNGLNLDDSIIKRIKSNRSIAWKNSRFSD